MADDTSSIVIEHLRRIRQTLDDMREDIREFKVRTSAVAMQLAAMNRRMDRFDERVARIERRLDLVEA